MCVLLFSPETAYFDPWGKLGGGAARAEDCFFWGDLVLGSFSAILFVETQGGGLEHFLPRFSVEIDFFLGRVPGGNWKSARGGDVFFWRGGRWEKKRAGITQAR